MQFQLQCTTPTRALPTEQCSGVATDEEQRKASHPPISPMIRTGSLGPVNFRSSNWHCTVVLLFDDDINHIEQSGLPKSNQHPFLGDPL